MKLPRIISGGMGVAISDYKLANAVSQNPDCLGVVSGTGLAMVLIGRLMQGDLNGDMLRAQFHVLLQDSAQRILKKYFIEGGMSTNMSYIRPPMWNTHPHA